MTRTTIASNPEIAREARTPVRLPDRRPAELFPGWGPKF
jgi:hypothetical protein